MEEIYFCAKDLNGVSGLMRLAKFDLSCKSAEIAEALRAGVFHRAAVASRSPALPLLRSTTLFAS
jgi:hypothetical protein